MSTAPESFPRFTYHPDPVGTGAVVKSDAVCWCCGRARGYIYPGPAYAIEELVEAICPWCIADGSAAEKFDAQFVSHLEITRQSPPYEPDVPASVREEIYKRTPGYPSWQGEWWLTHCGDACEFRGEMTGERFAALPPDLVAEHAKTNGFIERWQGHEAEYRRGSGISVYEFVCRHCGAVRLHADAS